MADGIMDPIIPTSDAMIRIAAQLGAVEQSLRSVVTHEKLINILNEQRKEVITSVRDSEVHVKDTLNAQSIQTDKRLQDMQIASDKRMADLTLAIDGMLHNRVGAALKAALDERDKDLAKARTEIENKAKDAVRGFKLLMTAASPIFLMSLAFSGWAIWKIFLGGGL